MPIWLIFSFLAALLWGAWALLFKLGTERMSSTSAKIWETAGYAVATAGILSWMLFKVTWDLRGFCYAVLGGASGSLANFLFFRAFSQGGKASVVTALVATCPVVTIVCAAIFLEEQISLHQAVACGCAAGALLAE